MSAETVMEALLGHASVVAVFSDRVALKELPQDTDMTQPCLVYEVIDDVPNPNVNPHDGNARSNARVRLSVTGLTLLAVINGHSAIRSALDFTHSGTYGGHRLLSFRKQTSGEAQRDPEVGVWWRPDDYMLAYYE